METNRKIDDKELVNSINDIIVRNYDAAKGFKTAADDVKNFELKEAFKNCSVQRSEFAGKLINDVIALGGTPANESSVLGALHRGWIDFKAALAVNEDKAVLNACVTGETAAVSEYDSLLDKGISGNLLNQIQQQRNEVNDTLQMLDLLAKKLD